GVGLGRRNGRIGNGHRVLGHEVIGLARVLDAVDGLLDLGQDLVTIDAGVVSIRGDQLKIGNERPRLVGVADYLVPQVPADSRAPAGNIYLDQTRRLEAEIQDPDVALVQVRFPVLGLGFELVKWT